MVATYKYFSGLAKARLHMAKQHKKLLYEMLIKDTEHPWKRDRNGCYI